MEIFRAGEEMKSGELVNLRGKHYSSATLDSRLVVLIGTDMLMYIRDYTESMPDYPGMGVYLFGEQLVVAEKSRFKRVKT